MRRRRPRCSASRPRGRVRPRRWRVCRLSRRAWIRLNCIATLRRNWELFTSWRTGGWVPLGLRFPASARPGDARRAASPTGVVEDQKNASRMPPDQRSDIGATASTTPKSTKMLLEPVRLLKLTQTTDVASGYILDGLTVQSKVTFLNGLTRRRAWIAGTVHHGVIQISCPEAPGLLGCGIVER